MSSIASFIERLPKAELHVHIEGTIEPELTFELARRNRVSLPYSSIEELQLAYEFSNLQDFLDLYYQGMNVLLEEQDFYDLTLAYIKKIKEQNVLHTEIFFDPQAHTARGIAFETVIDGMHRALVEAECKLGVTSKLIMCFLRHLDQDDAFETLEIALNYKDRIIGVGLDSSEVGNPPSKFKEVFEHARAEGFLTAAHAGEEGPADYVWEALDLLRVARIDHGNRSLDDDALVKRLAETRTPLTLCPLSNLRLSVVNEMKRHPLKEMMRRGLLVTVNSDDPAYFGGYINENYKAVQGPLGLSLADMATLARNSFEAAFVGEPQRQGLMAQLENYLAAASETLDQPPA